MKTLVLLLGILATSASFANEAVDHNTTRSNREGSGTHQFNTTRFSKSNNVLKGNDDGIEHSNGGGGSNHNSSRSNKTAWPPNTPTPSPSP